MAHGGYEQSTCEKDLANLPSQTEQQKNQIAGSSQATQETEIAVIDGGKKNQRYKNDDVADSLERGEVSPRKLDNELQPQSPL